MEKSDSDPSQPHRNRRHSPERPSPYKRPRSDDGMRGSLTGGFERCDRRKMTRFCDLPEKVVADIMSWLPPKYLLQLKCVQKSWNALINTLVKSHWFVIKHYKNSGCGSSLFQRSSPPYYMQPRNHETITSFMTLNEADDNDDQISFNIKEFTLPHPITCFRCSQCNGIILLPDKETNKVLLCNPAIREFKLLESSCFGSSFEKHITELELELHFAVDVCLLHN